MNTGFRDALIWHIEKHGTKVSELSKETGVSRDVINKLLSKSNGTTSAENALLLAAYYGMSLEHFIQKRRGPQRSSIKDLLALLDPDEERLLEAQLMGLVRGRAAQSNR
jgi:transcriptional regulator with XRE-family HTH domain